MAQSQCLTFLLPLLQTEKEQGDCWQGHLGRMGRPDFCFWPHRWQATRLWASVMGTPASASLCATCTGAVRSNTLPGLGEGHGRAGDPEFAEGSWRVRPFPSLALTKETVTQSRIRGRSLCGALPLLLLQQESHVTDFLPPSCFPSHQGPVGLYIPVTACVNVGTCRPLFWAPDQSPQAEWGLAIGA